MRRTMMATAITALAGAGSLFASGAQALPGAGRVRAADAVEQAQVVCPRPFWNGYRWVQPPCRQVIAPVQPYAYVQQAPPPVVIVRPYRRYRPVYRVY